MIDEEALKIVLNDKTFSKDEAISIVGGLSRFNNLCERGSIRYRKSTSAQNSRWMCNAYDVISHAQLGRLYQKLPKVTEKLAIVNKNSLQSCQS